MGVDRLTDGEETNLGRDGFATDPWKTDTDADGCSYGYEPLTKGTNPLAWDTDGDGVRDSSDRDPLHNLLVAVRVNYIHHGASPWCSPELVGIVRVNDDYTWVSQHVVATLDQFGTSCGWPDPQYSTSYFGYTYYADVPDDVSSVSLRATAWAINPGRGDDILVDAFVTYTLNSGTSYQMLWNGNSWYSFDIWTVALPKAKTLFVTDGNATITLANGQSRLVGQDRYYVFTFDVTSAYGPFVMGVNAVVVPRSIFLDSKLRKDFDAGTFAPLTDATLYGEDLGQSKVSESVAGTIATSLSGADAYDVLSRLLRNTTNVLVYSYVDVTSYVVLLNLPADVVNILPWSSPATVTGIVEGPTGAMPADFWQKIGAAASTLVNILVCASQPSCLGQMVYKGLVALGTFLVNLAQAIVDWGMKALGAIWEKVVAVAQKAADLFGQLVRAIVDAIVQLLTGLLQAVQNALHALIAVQFQLFKELARLFFDLHNGGISLTASGVADTVSTRSEGTLSVLTPLATLLQMATITIAVLTGPIGFAINFAIGTVVDALLPLLIGNLIPSKDATMLTAIAGLFLGDWAPALSLLLPGLPSGDSNPLDFNDASTWTIDALAFHIAGFGIILSTFGIVNSWVDYLEKKGGTPFYHAPYSKRTLEKYKSSFIKEVVGWLINGMAAAMILFKSSLVSKEDRLRADVFTLIFSGIGAYLVASNLKLGASIASKIMGLIGLGFAGSAIALSIIGFKETWDNP